MHVPARGFTAPWRRCRRRRNRGPLARLLSATVPMLRAAHVTGARLAMLRLRVGGACAVATAALGASRRLLA
eukprot:6606412-Alexandrium_andersonii.AAC.1